MPLTDDKEKLDSILELFYDRFDKYNTKVLVMLGEAIKQFDDLTPSQAHELAQEMKYSTDVDELLNELSKISGKSMEDIDKLLEKVAEENVGFAKEYYKVRGVKYVPYEDNVQLQRYVRAIKGETYDTFKNLAKSKNVGFTFKDKDDKTIFKPLKTVYRDLIDEAVYNVTSGVSDYQSAMRNTIRQLADSGIKVHEASTTYTSGYNRRIDSTVRQSVLTGMRKVNIAIQEEIGKELNADGVEISAHFPCAEDHLPYQGRQFSKKAFEEINSSLDRPIGDEGYNCGHFIYQIILGVNQPSYTKKQLDKLNSQTLEKFEYEGKTYSKYEASQVQRKLETEIRKQKDRQIIAKASGDKEEIGNAQAKITQLTSKYNDFSKKAGLDADKDRLRVSGYRRTKVK